MQSCKSDAEQEPLQDDIWMNMEMLGEESASGLSWDQSGPELQRRSSKVLEKRFLKSLF